MARPSRKINVYLEVGKKKTFAGAIDWPGWSRAGGDKESALKALLDYGPRYERVLHATQLGFEAPASPSAFVVVERLKGNATTDFGAPGIAPASDSKSVSPKQLQRLEMILKASWQAFDAVVETASGKALRTGPRGGGRQLEKMIQHLLESDTGYVHQVGWKFQLDKTGSLDQQLEQTRYEIVNSLRASARGEIPKKGPRGGIRWTARYFVRRVAWHVLDHTWEIEDRLISD
jgi:hypothetical protein